MFRDREEELARLEAELLAEEEPEADDSPNEDDEAEYDGEYEEDYEEEYDEEYDDYDPEQEDEEDSCQEDYPTYETGYRAYNTDRSDTDLEDYSEAVRSAKRSGCLTGAMIVLCLLILSVLGLIFLILYTRGLL